MNKTVGGSGRADGPRFNAELTCGLGDALDVAFEDVRLGLAPNRSGWSCRLPIIWSEYVAMYRWDFNHLVVTGFMSWHCNFEAIATGRSGLHMCMQNTVPRVKYGT